MTATAQIIAPLGNIKIVILHAEPELKSLHSSSVKDS